VRYHHGPEGEPSDEQAMAEPGTSDAGDPRRRQHLRLVSAHDEPAAPPRPLLRPMSRDTRRWCRRSLGILAAEAAQTPPTPLLRIPCPELPDIELMLKDESRLPSGSLKHRLARALFAQGIASGAIGPDTAIVEGSSGSTAIAEAWFARRLGLRYIALVPASTAAAKRDAIAREGGEIRLVPLGSDLHAAAEQAAHALGGYHMDQFARAAEVADWRGGGNAAAELLAQLEAIGQRPPAWIVTGAGTGGTATTIGRHLCSNPRFGETRLCVVDPEHSAYFKGFVSGDRSATGAATHIVEGIGRGRIGAAFEPGVIDHMVSVSDEGSVSGARWLARRLRRRYGPSTGTNIIGALILGQAMQRRRESGTIVLLGCDDGRRYSDTVYDDGWCAANGVAPAGWDALLAQLGTTAFPAAY